MTSRCEADMLSEEDVNDILLKIEGQRHSPTAKNPIQIRCYWGSQRGSQVEAYDLAVARVIEHFTKHSIEVQHTVLDLKRLRESSISLKELFDWLLGGHVHFIVTHLHQGLENFGWSIEEIYAEMKRLKYHPGFPNMEKLKCPIFCQDKFLYLEHLPKHVVLPTYKIPVSLDIELDEMTQIIQSIVELHPEGTNFIMKAPYSTNSLHFKKYFLAREEGIVSRIAKYVHFACQDMFGLLPRSSRPSCYLLPYLMLQVKNSSYSKEDFIRFASDILAIISMHDAYIVDGLVRVDIFKNDDSALVVNELESMEAVYFSNDHHLLIDTNDFIGDYWEKKIYKSISDI